jgi:hypothetical protein
MIQSGKRRNYNWSWSGMRKMSEICSFGPLLVWHRVNEVYPGLDYLFCEQGLGSVFFGRASGISTHFDDVCLVKGFFGVRVLGEEMVDGLFQGLHDLHLLLDQQHSHGSHPFHELEILNGHLAHLEPHFAEVDHGEGQGGRDSAPSQLVP